MINVVRNNDQYNNVYMIINNRKHDQYIFTIYPQFLTAIVLVSRICGVIFPNMYRTMIKVAIIFYLIVSMYS